MKRSFVSKLVSIIIAVTVAFGSMPTMLALAEDLDINESRTIEAVTLLEKNTGKTLADIAKENGWLRYDWRLSYDLENNHLQGLTVDDELKYMYLSTGDYILKLDMSTGSVVGSITNFGKSASMTEDMGAHLGCLDYYDGRIYCGMIAANPSAKLFVLSIEASKIDRLGIDAETLEDGVDAILLKDHIDDYRSQVSDLFTGWKGIGNFTMSDEEGHRFGCGGVDGVTLGTYPGDASGKMYIIAGYSTYASVNNLRQDNTYIILKFYPLDKVWDSETHQPKGEQNIRYTQSRIKSAEYDENEALPAEKTLFIYTGNIDWGVQGLEYEEDTGDIVAYCYGPTDFWIDNSQPPRVMFVIDGSIAPTEKVLELGQSNTLTNEEDKAYVKAIADAYSTDTDKNGVIDDDERLKGEIGVLKCFCGNREIHSAASVGDETWGDTGVKKAEYPICGEFLFSRGDEGIAYLGKGSDGAGYFYSRGDHRGSTIADASGSEVNLWKRTIEESGKYTYTLVEPNFEKAKPILHYSMDGSDMQTVNGVTYMKNTLDVDGKHSAIVEGTVVGTGVDGSDDGALSFNAWNYPDRVDQMYLSDETIRYIDTKIHNQAYSYSFWAKMATNENTDGNFNPFIGFYRKDGTYAGVFEQRWRGEVEYIVNGIGTTSVGNPGKEGVSIGSKDNGWHFYTVTEKDGEGTVYCDGSKKGSYNVQKDHLYTNNISDFIIGGGDAKIWYDKNNRGRLIGSVDELTIYSGTLTADEVKSEYAKITKDGTKETAAAVDVSSAPDNKLRANYDLTVDKDKDLTVDVGGAVSEIDGLVKGTDYTVAGNSIIFKASWLSTQNCGIKNLTMDEKSLELTITDKNIPLINYSFSKDNVIGNVVKDSSVYGADAITTAKSFDYSRSGEEDGALIFDGHDYKNPDYVKLSAESANWLNSVIENGYTVNFWANATAENGSVMAMAGLYAADARPLGVVESYELSSSDEDNSSDGKMLIHADVADSSKNKVNAANSTAAVSENKININEWHMYTVSYDKDSSIVTLYIDGINKSSSIVNDDIIGNIAQLFVGHQYKKYYNATGARDWMTRGGFKGVIDGISVYNSHIGDEAVAALYSDSDVINGRIVFKDDFEEESGLSAAYIKKTGNIAPDTVADGNNNHVLRMQLDSDNIQVVRKLNEELTDGIALLDYRVKPSANTSTMFWLMGGDESDKVRLPMFVSDGRIAVTDDYGLDTTIGNWDKESSDIWYEVSVKLNLDYHTVDVTVKKDGTVLAQKKNLHTGINKIGYMQFQMYSGTGSSYFDNIIIASAFDTNSDDGFIINDDFEKDDMDYSISSSEAGKAEIVKDGTNSVLNLEKYNGQWSVAVQKALNKTYTNGTIRLSYKIKPAENVTGTVSLEDGGDAKIRLPEFSSGGIIRITNDYYNSLHKTVRVIGNWEVGKWYEVNAAVNLDAGTYDISVNEIGTDSLNVASLYGDYLNLKEIKLINMEVSGNPAAVLGFDDVTVRHEKTSSEERLVFKDDFELRENPTGFEFWDNWDYAASQQSGATVKEIDGSHAAALRKVSAEWQNSLVKSFADNYTSGIITLSYSVKPNANNDTVFWLGAEEWGWEDKCLYLPKFERASSTNGNKTCIKIAGPGIEEFDLGSWNETWYDVCAKINLNTGICDVSIKNRTTGEEIAKSGIKTTLSDVKALRMTVWGTDNNDSYFDNIVVKCKTGPDLPYYQDFEDGTIGVMITENTGGTEQGDVVDNPDGNGKVFRLSGSSGAPLLRYYLNDISKGKLKIEADIKTGAASCSSLLMLTHPDNKLTQAVLFGNNNDHPGIWINWDEKQYSEVRKENEWYHIKLVIDVDTGTMDSWVTDSDGQTYSLRNYNYAANIGTKVISTVYFQIWSSAEGDTSYIDNIQLTVPAENIFEVTSRTLSDDGVQIKTLDALKASSSPTIDIDYSNTTAKDKSFWVSVNSYKDSQLITCMSQTVTIGADETEGTKSIDISDISFDEADYVNVLIWESAETMIPICESLAFRTQTSN